MLFNLLQAEPIEGAIADTLAEAMPQAAAAQPVEMHESLFSLFKMGGTLMWVLLALSVSINRPSPSAANTTIL